MPDTPHTTPPKNKATTEAKVLTLSCTPTTHGKITFASKYCTTPKTTNTAKGYQIESWVIQAIEIGNKAPMAIPT